MDCSWACLPAWIAGGKAKRFGTSGSGTESMAPLSEVFFSFLRSWFSLSGELGRGRLCCAAQTDRDLSETPPRYGGGRQQEVRGRARGECGPSFAEGVPLGTGAVDALRWTRRAASNPLARKKSAHTPHAHTRRERTVRTAPPRTSRHARCLTSRAHHALHGTCSASRRVCVCLCSLRRCGLVSACE